MTAQVREIISIDGEQRSLCALPLAPLFRSWRPAPRFGAEISSTSWEIVGTDLFLTDFNGTPVRNDDPTESGLVALPIIAHGINDAGNEEAAERWKNAVAHLERMPKDDHGESISEEAYCPIRDDDGFLSGDYRGGVDLDASS